ncbi:MAG TPA: PAS domain S-box protein, partial [Acidimicrobiales bacterium]|nr:PAS domain S-box protein [Acidimicrobiales bacterium]
FPASLGYTAEEFAELDVVGQIHDDDIAALDAVVRSLGKGQAVSGIETRYRAKDGSWHWWEWTASLDHSTGLVYGSARDTTQRRATINALKSSQHNLQTIIDHSPSAIFAKDLKGRYVLVNNEFLSVIGLERDRVLGRTIRDLWPDTPAADEDADGEVLSSGRAVTTDAVLELPEGPRTYMVTRFPLRTEGRLVGTAAVSTNISERTKTELALREREQLHQTLERASPDIIIVIDAAGTIVSVSEACEQILGVPRDIEPTRLLAIVHPDDRVGFSQAIDRLRSSSGAMLDLRIRMRHSEGFWVPLDVRGQPVVDDEGKVDGAVVVARDITEELAFEEQLRAAVEASERASKAKSGFLSRMSHELRTPLNSVLGFAQLLLMEDLEPAQSEAVGHIVRAARHLLDLIDEALDISRIETGGMTLNLHPVQIRAVVTDAVNLARPLAERAGIGVRTDLGEVSDLYIYADHQRLLQVFLNLLSNAVKYNRQGGRVDLHARVIDQDRLRVSVTDTGSGIPPDRVHRVFEPFDRLGAEFTRVEGTGVGLTLSKQLVETMGGSIDVVSIVGEGSTFSVDLRVAPAPTEKESERHERPDPAWSIRPVKILYVEDNETNRTLLESLLGKQSGVELFTAASGVEGIQVARSARPDLVLLDLHLPDMGGEEVLAALDVDPSTAEIPVVVVSADATDEQSQKLLAKGVMAYLTKPVELDELIGVVNTVRKVAPT